VKNRRPNLGDFAGGILFLLAGLGVMIESIRLTIGTPTNPQPGFFPFLGGAILIGLSLVLTIRAWLGIGKRPEPFGEVRRPAALVAGTGVYVLILDPLGYVLATIPLGFLVLWILGVKSWQVLGSVSVGLSVVTYFLFAHLLGIELPPGLLKLLG